jgi:superfamily II DNA or RNA helicase
MDRALTIVSAAEVRAVMAHVWLDPHVDPTLGSVTLRPHQREAVARARAALDEHGGALIADDVGLGKTFIALAVAADARRPLVIGPAALRSMWARACEHTGVRAEFRSYEALSRAPMPDSRHDLIVMDEAHHVRTPRTARYRHIARGVVGARVLLLSATPVHNSVGDLRALLALFLGAVAWVIDESELATHVIRREHAEVGLDVLPTLTAPQWVTPSHDDTTLDAIVSLPPPVPACDGGDGGALLSFTLARLWASSHAALRAALVRRVQRARALEDALSCGRHPTAAELRAWTIGEDAAQLAFPELVTTSMPSDASELLRATQAHAAAIETLLHSIPTDSPRDRERADLLREIVARHRGENVIAFTQFSDTATTVSRLLRDHVRCCRLDGRGARVAGGKLSRREALSRFAPRASGAPEPPERERIELLIATDLLSEGVNLQDASVVVHLDLPWTSARMAQRVGRSRRLGAQHRTTSVYTFAPPAAAASLLRQEQRLREKLRAAARTTGACGAILPVRLSLRPELPSDDPPSPVRAVELLRRMLSRWRDEDQSSASSTLSRAPSAACVRAAQAGALALVRRGDEPSLVAICGTHPSDRPTDVLSAARCAEGGDAPQNEDWIAAVTARLESWLASNAAALAAGMGHTIAGTARRIAMQRVAHIASRAPRHCRAVVAPLAAEARRIITAPYGVGAERILAELAGAPLPDEAWLRAVRAFGEANCKGAGSAKGAGGAEGSIEALIVFGP